MSKNYLCAAQLGENNNVVPPADYIRNVQIGKIVLSPLCVTAGFSSWSAAIQDVLGLPIAPDLRQFHATPATMKILRNRNGTPPASDFGYTAESRDWYSSKNSRR